MPAAEQAYGQTKRVDTPAGDTVFEGRGRQDPFAAAVGKLRQIYDAADPVLIRALDANLAAFSQAASCRAVCADLRAQNRALRERVGALEERLKLLEAGARRAGT